MPTRIERDAAAAGSGETRRAGRTNAAIPSWAWMIGAAGFLIGWILRGLQ